MCKSKEVQFTSYVGYKKLRLTLCVVVPIHILLTNKGIESSRNATMLSTFDAASRFDRL